MKVVVKERESKLEAGGAYALFALEGVALKLPKGFELAPRALERFKGEFREQRVLEAPKGSGAAVVVGLGQEAELTVERVRRAVAVAVRAAEASGLHELQVLLPRALEKACGGPAALAQAAAEAARMAAYRYQPYKSKPKAAKLARATIVGGGREFRAGAEKGLVWAEANCYARDLQNAPANKMRPRELASEAKKLAARSSRLRCKVLGVPDLRRLKMGALLGVAQGSIEPPVLIHLIYRPRGRAQSRVAFVGKGLTFDSGGISIKPAARMWDMKYDMSGGAAVLGLFHALASLDLPFEIHGVVAASENLPDAGAIKPGDVVTAMNGTTIEVLNTDAEGRLILCDALNYVRAKIEPDTIIDLATLTGAVITALGHEFTGMFPTTERLRDELHRAGEATCERVWPLPLSDLHREQMKGEVADLKNINNSDQGNGSSAGAAFLAHFVGDTEWCHLDIAGTAWGTTSRDYVGGAQGTGVGVRLLLAWLDERR